MPRITVIIPTFNRVKWLGHAIESVLAQTYSDYELVVVDDGSTDETSRLLTSYAPPSATRIPTDSLQATEPSPANLLPQIPTDSLQTTQHAPANPLQVIRLSENRGVSAARNVAIRATDSEWIAFLDSDDRWLSQKLQQQVTTLQDRPECPVHFTDEIWIRNGRRVNPHKKHQKQEGWIFQPSLSLCLMAPSTILIRRDILDTTGLFDETLPVCEDYDLWLKITARYPVALLNEKLMIRYGGHPDQLSSRHWGNDRYRVQSLQNILDTVPLRPEDRQATIAKLIEKCTILLNGFAKRGNTKEEERYRKIMEQWGGEIGGC